MLFRSVFPLHQPEVSWKDGHGVPHRITNAVASSPPAYDVGEHVEVIYQPNDPENARIDSFAESWLLPLVLGVFGTVFLGFALAIFRSRRQVEHESAM